MPGDRFIELAMAENRQILDVLFRHAGEGVTVQDQTGNLIYANDQAARTLGENSGAAKLSVDGDTLMRGVTMLGEDGVELRPEDLPARRVLAGAPEAEMVMGHRRQGRTRWLMVRSSPIKDSRGKTVWALSFILDITQQVVADRRDRMIRSLRDAMVAVVDVNELMKSYLDILVPSMCRAASIHLADDAGMLVSARPIQAGGDEVKFVRQASNSIQGRTIASGSPIVQTGRAEELLTTIGQWSVEDLDVEDATEISVSCLPLRTRGMAVGAVTVVDVAGSHRLADHDDPLLFSFVEQAGVSLADAQLMAYEREMADVLVRGLIPSRLTEIPGLETAVRYVAQSRISGLSGDFYDVVECPDGKYVVAVGDIEGKGIGAAARVGMVRQTLRATVAMDADPAIVFRQLNDVLMSEDTGRMCTLAYLVVDPQDATVAVSLAGHPPPVLIAFSGASSFVGRPCPPLGISDQHEPIIQESKLLPGDTLVVYTDGFAVGNEAPPETIQPLLVGAEREEPEAMLDRLMAALTAAQPIPRDDVVLLAIRRR